MGRVNTPILSETGRKELETLFKKSDNHSLRKRCQTILLKAEGRHSKDVGSIVGMCHVSVNSWLKRYKSDGIAGLYIKPGRGKKPLIDKKSDEHLILEAVSQHRQKISYRQGRMGGFKWKRSKQEHF
ncbi:MAG: helix-turn-helix domain containing protein [Sphingobacteriales bacterium]|nr:MAG: helix-turn-helix domain containing protein [Sphingobacteriales bacterium]